MIVRQKDKNTYTVSLADEEAAVLEDRAEKESTKRATTLHAAIVTGWATCFSDKEDKE